MLELHQIEEGMQLLSGRPTAPSRSSAERVKGSKWNRKSLGRVFSIEFLGPGTIRDFAESPISPSQHAPNSGSWWPSNETPENGKLLARKQGQGSSLFFTLQIS